MLRDSALRGYLLEESLAWLLRFSGYRLLVHEDQDPAELVTEGQTLRVRGRGALHQVDVLGEFAFTPAFSMPVRLFLEAKYYQTRCELEVVRNAHGVMHDVNENFMTGPGTRPRQRDKYSYALFSASGFTADAQKYALAHQISLVDLSGACCHQLVHRPLDVWHTCAAPRVGGEGVEPVRVPLAYPVQVCERPAFEPLHVPLGRPNREPDRHHPKSEWHPVRPDSRRTVEHQPLEKLPTSPRVARRHRPEQ